MGYTSPYDLKKPVHEGGYGLTEAQDSLFGSMVTVGAIGGALLGGALLDSIGRTLYVGA